MKKLLFTLLLTLSYFTVHSEEMQTIKVKAYPDTMTQMPLSYVAMYGDDKFFAFGQSLSDIKMDEYHHVSYFSYVAIFDSDFNIIKSNHYKHLEKLSIPLPFIRGTTQFRRVNDFYINYAYVQNTFGSTYMMKTRLDDDLNVKFHSNAPISNTIKEYTSRSLLFANETDVYDFGVLKKTKNEMSDEYYIRKLDTLGEEVFRKTYILNVPKYNGDLKHRISSFAEPHNDRSSYCNGSVQIDKDGNLYAVDTYLTSLNQIVEEDGMSNSYAAAIVRPFAFKFSKSGELLVSKQLDSSFVSSYVNSTNYHSTLYYNSNSNSNFLIDSERSKIYTLSAKDKITFDLSYYDSNWELIWRKTIKFDTLISEKLAEVVLSLRTAQIAKNGDIVLIGEYSNKLGGIYVPNLQDKAIICRFDSEGNTKFVKTLQLNDNPKYSYMKAKELFVNSKGEYFAFYMLAKFVPGVPGATNEQSIIVKFTDNFSSVEEPQILSQNMQIAPMPVSNFFNVKFTLDKPGTATIKLYNQAGEIVLTAEHNALSAGEQNAQINTANLPAGGYICHISSGNKVITQQLIKQ